jgi:ATP-dependent Clp protease ATP-binding subunit ClpA
MQRAAYGFTRSKREGEDLEAINRMFAPEFRNRLDAVVTFRHLPAEVIVKVVDKFIMQLDAQLADRNVTIELTDEARNWLVEHGYDEHMGARPARVIQQAIKTPLADEVLFGRLKNGGTVRVVVTADGIKKLGFVFPEGPVLPRPGATSSGRQNGCGQNPSAPRQIRRLKDEEGDDEPDEDMPGDDEAETVGRGEEPDPKH